VVKGEGPNLFSTSLRIVCRKDRVAESPRYTGRALVVDCIALPRLANRAPKVHEIQQYVGNSHDNAHQAALQNPAITDPDSV